jgi:phosphonate transport system substrate-binding protein
MPTPPGRNVSERMQMKKFAKGITKWTSLVLPMALILSACQSTMLKESPIPTSSPTPVVLESVTATLTPTPRPSSTPTLSPPGSEANPITLAFILQPEDMTAIDAAQEIALLVSEDSDMTVESVIYPDFISLSTAILNNEVDLFWLGPLEYLYLSGQGVADVLLVTNHLGVYAYGVQYMANVNRGFSSYFDPEANESFGDPLSALQQFSGTRPCFITPESLPGYFTPLGLLATTSTPTLDPVFVYDYSAVVRALYIGGICDFGVGYALIGDPRTAGDILQDIPDAENIVQVIWQSEGIIPNTNLSASPTLQLNLQVKLQESILDLQNTPEGLSLLSTALNYEVAALRSELDSYYNPLRAALAPLELDLGAITQQSTQ